jgi:hypothetical protein
VFACLREMRRAPTVVFSLAEYGEEKGGGA